jgi:3-methyladenine DNA glycosylase AlkD
MSYLAIHKELLAIGSPKQAKLLQGFFKTGPGEYGEGDIFIGCKVPEIRTVAKAHHNLDRKTLLRLLHSKIHEERLLALLVMILQYRQETAAGKQDLYRLYMNNTAWINNWDLVDLSAPHIPGAHLFEKSRRPLFTFARSRDLWKKRIAIVSTAWFIRQRDFADTLAISDILLHDKHDLIQKAVGWMLREVGKKDQPVEETFLKSRYQSMPRTMLRYAIERFDEPLRQRYLKGSI